MNKRIKEIIITCSVLLLLAGCGESSNTTELGNPVETKMTKGVIEKTDAIDVVEYKVSHKEVTECDTLAAHSNDSNKVADGIKTENLDKEKAFKACAIARSEYPEEARFVYQEARVLFAMENYGEAFFLLKDATSKNYIAAFPLLGYMYHNGLGVDRDESEAVRWYKMAAIQGEPVAQQLLARNYETGSSMVPKDYNEAVRWYKEAVGKGSPEAHYFLSNMYDRGKGVSQDRKEAEKLLRKAAELGSGDAQYLMALKYKEGRGVIEDQQVAMKWYQMAAKQGNLAAQKYLDGQ